MTFPRYAVLAALLVLTLGCGGGSDGETPTTTETSPAEPEAVSAPEGTSLEVWFEGGSSALDGIRDEIRTPGLRALFPGSMGEIMELLAPLPGALRERIANDARVYGLRFDERTVVAARVREDATAAAAGAPLGPGVALHPGGPNGAQWVMGLPAEGRPVIALHQRILFMATSAEDLERAMPFLLQEATRPASDVVNGHEARAHGLHVRAASSGFPRRLRNLIDGGLDERLGAALDGVRRERARHEAAPALGDPEPLIRRSQRTLRELTALLPDVQTIDAHFGRSRTGLALHIELGVAADSPAGEVLAASQEVPLASLAALPAGVGLGGIVSPSLRDDEGLLATLAAVAGDRLQDTDRAALHQTRAAFGGAAGDAVLMGIGQSPEGAWGFGATLGAGLPTERLVSFMRVPYVETLLESVLGCPERPGLRTPDTSTAVTQLCARPEPPSPSLHVLRADGGPSVFAITQDLRPGTHPAPARIRDGIREPSRGALREQTDARRILSALPERGLTGWVLVPGQLGGALGLFATPATRALGEVLTLESAPAPTFIIITRTTPADADDDAPLRMGVDIALAPGGIDQLGQAFVMFSRLF